MLHLKHLMLLEVQRSNAGVDEKLIRDRCYEYGIINNINLISY